MPMRTDRSLQARLLERHPHFAKMLDRKGQIQMNTGRRILAATDMTPVEFRDAYWRAGSVERAATALGISDDLMRRLVVEARIQRPPLKPNSQGYRFERAPWHPRANQQGCMPQHRLVIERVLGRFLEPSEVVHHIDCDPGNNAPENLTVFASVGEHLAHHHKLRKEAAATVEPEGVEQF